MWKEQTPKETFSSGKGVCIDTARLYSVMARAVGLETRVVTGKGADGRGGFGNHAWNEVKLGDENGVGFRWMLPGHQRGIGSTRLISTRRISERPEPLHDY